jgi:hypothetical protein
LLVQDQSLEEQKNERDALIMQVENMKKPFGFMNAYYQQEKVMGNGGKRLSN